MMMPSTTWMMPFEAITSGCTTLTPPTLRPLKPSTMMLRPLSVVSVVVRLTSAAGSCLHHVQLQDAGQLVAVLRQEQPLELALGQLVEGGVARREDGEGPRVAERLHAGVGQRLGERAEAGVGVEDVADRRRLRSSWRAGGDQEARTRCEREADESPAVHHERFLPRRVPRRPEPAPEGEVTRRDRASMTGACRGMARRGGPGCCEKNLSHRRFFACTPPRGLVSSAPPAAGALPRGLKIRGSGSLLRLKVWRDGLFLVLRSLT